MPTTWPLLVGPTLILRLPSNEETARIHRWLDDPATAQFLNAEDPIQALLEPPVIVDPVTLRPMLQAERLRRIISAIKTAQIVDRTYSLMGSQLRPSPTNLEYVRTARPAALVFAILQKRNHRLSGVIVLNVSILHQVGTIRTVIAPEVRRLHFGREAKALILDFAFGRLQLEKVFSEMLGDNLANRRVNDALGFVLEGTLRNHVMVLGRRRDLLCMGILREEWIIGKWLGDISPKRLP